MAAFAGIWATGIVGGLLFWPSPGVLARSLITLALFSVYLASKPHVILAVTQHEIVVLRTKWWNATAPVPEVLQRYSFELLRTAGPSTWQYRPVIVGYRRYWAHARYSEMVDQLTGVSSAVPELQWRR